MTPGHVAGKSAKLKLPSFKLLFLALTFLYFLSHLPQPQFSGGVLVKRAFRFFHSFRLWRGVELSRTPSMSRHSEEAEYSSQERSPLRGVSPESRISPIARRVLPEQMANPHLQHQLFAHGQRMLPVRIPQFSQNHVLLAPSLADELQAIARASAKLSAFQPNHIVGPAHILLRYGIQSLEAFNQIDKQARGYLFEDLRRREQMTFPELPRNGKSLPPHC